MKILIVCDPPSGFVPYKDTTKALIECAWSRGHSVDWTPTEGLSADGQSVLAAVAPLRRPSATAATWYEQGEWSTQDARDYNWILVRTDPPVDTAYLHMCQLLALHADIRAKTVNNPSTLTCFNEKISALRFSAWTPPTIVTADPTRIREFVEAHRGRAVGKPLDSMGGGGVVVLETTHMNFASLVTQLTDGGHRAAVVQRYIDRVGEGDKRVLVVDGLAVGTVLRVPKPGDFRGNIAAGATTSATTLTSRERQILESVGPTLVACGLRFVGLDLVGEYLTEVNVTSPTGAQEIKKLSGIDVPAVFIEALERSQ